MHINSWDMLLLVDPFQKRTVRCRDTCLSQYTNLSWRHTIATSFLEYNGGASPRGHLNVTWRGDTHFFKNLHSLLTKKICISIPCFGTFRLQNNRKTIGKTIAYCSSTNSHNLFKNFWSIFIPSSRIYNEKWHPEKRHVLYSFMWQCPIPGCIQNMNKRQKEANFSKEDRIFLVTKALRNFNHINWILMKRMS